MIIALSGRLPTRLKIGENEAEWQEVAGEVIETAVVRSFRAAMVSGWSGSSTRSRSARACWCKGIASAGLHAAR